MSTVDRGNRQWRSKATTTLKHKFKFGSEEYDNAITNKLKDGKINSKKRFKRWYTIDVSTVKEEISGLNRNRSNG